MSSARASVAGVSRRRFILGASAGALLGGCQSRPVSAFLRAMQSWNGGFQAWLYSANRLAPQLPATAQTPEAAIPVYYISDFLPQPPPNWTLSIGGLVRRPMVLTLAQLQEMTAVEMRVQHHCVEGWSAVASWRGVRMVDLARLVDAQPSARYVEFRSFDSNYWSSWDRASAFHPQTILAYAMNGHPLSAEHGAPVRLYSAVKLGYKMVKYLSAINFMPAPSGGYWEDQGYDWFAGV
ncbi:MAG TPA: molybdopterin-dependent oxidoreductase [Candidatus Binataceae bacterium]|nr:molybdopterin-dependent oxidoreductase [Candidatus Binataceae bacterium]